MPPFTGSIPDFVADEQLSSFDLQSISDALAALAEPWTSFTPTFAATGGGAAIGNGTLTGKYNRVGKYVTYQGKLTAGSTTTFGSGVLTMTMPVASVDSLAIGTVLAIPTALTGSRVGVVNLRSVSSLQFWADPNDVGGNGGQFTATVPFAWASGHQWWWAITYEAA